MRNPGRIDTIVEKLGVLWHCVPDFRFWQFISFIFEAAPENKVRTDPWFWEDDTWDEMISTLIEKYKGDTD